MAETNQNRSAPAGKNKPRWNGNKNRQGANARGNYRGGKRGGDADGIKLRHNDYRPHYGDDAPFAQDLSRDDTVASEGLVIGRNAVRELLKSSRAVDKLLVRRGDREGSIVVIVAEAVNRSIPVIEVEAAKLDAIAGGVPHQGVIAMASAKEYVTVEEMLALAEAKGEKPLLVIADGIEDPYNLGALIRCAECAGAHGLIIPKRRAVGLTPVVTKSSAGALEHVPVAKVANIASTIEMLKKRGIWVFASEAGGTPYYESDFNVPCAIVFGSEGEGIGRLIHESCDFTVSIPMYGQVNSLNVSTAASVILCEAARQQRS